MTHQVRFHLHSNLAAFYSLFVVVNMITKGAQFSSTLSVDLILLPSNLTVKLPLTAGSRVRPFLSTSENHPICRESTTVPFVCSKVETPPTYREHVLCIFHAVASKQCEYFTILFGSLHLFTNSEDIFISEDVYLSVKLSLIGGS